MTRIVHIIESMILGGAARSMVALAKHSSQCDNDFEHIIVSLDPATSEGLELANESGLKVLDHPSGTELKNILSNADVVQVHYWNNPTVFNFLKSDLPEMRLVIFYHIAGDRIPQVIIPEIVEMADWNVPCSPYTFEVVRSFQNRLGSDYLKRTRMVYDATDFDRIENLSVTPHDGFNVGYIGTVDYIKMHPNFLQMSAAVDIPDIKFLVCGGWKNDEIAEETLRMGIGDKFRFLGFVENITPVLSVLDVYGYPLREDTYAAAELNLQEVMFFGIPPVVFPHGGIPYLIEHEKTGLIVHSEQEYTQAIEYLYHNPKVRQSLGHEAKKYATREFGAKNAAPTLNKIFASLLAKPKTRHQWGYDMHLPLLDQKVPAIRSEAGSASELFLQSLGEHGSVFINSASTQQPMRTRLKADSEIEKMSVLVADNGLSLYQKLDPEDRNINYWLGVYRKGHGDYTEAITHFVKAAENGFEDWRTLWNLLVLLLEQDRIQEAGQVVDLLGKRYPQWQRELIECGITPPMIPSKNRTLDSSSSFEKLITSRNRILDQLVSAELKISQFYRKQGKFNEAVTSLKKLINSYPDYQQIRIEIGDIYKEWGLLQKASVWYKKAVSGDKLSSDDKIRLTVNLAETGAVQEAVLFLQNNQDTLQSHPDFNRVLEILSSAMENASQTMATP